MKRSQQLYFPHFQNSSFWLIDVQNIRDDEVAWAKSILSPDELKRSSRLVFEEDRRRSMITYAIVKIHLGAPTLLWSQFGKPYIQNHPLHFNISHSKTHAFLGVHPTKPIGVDIEKLNNNISLFDALDSFLHPEEKAWLATVSDQNDAAYSLWCAKEALLKAIGTGFSEEPIPLLHFHADGHFKSQDKDIYLYNESQYKIAICIVGG